MKKRFPALVLGGILALGLLSGCGRTERCIIGFNGGIGTGTLR